MFEALENALLKTCIMYNIPVKNDVYYKVVREELTKIKNAYILLTQQIAGLEKQNRELQFENRNLRQILYKNEIKTGAQYGN